MATFHHRMLATAATARDVFVGVGARLRGEGLVADAQLVIVLAQRMTMMGELVEGDATYFDSVANYAGHTSRATRHLSDTMAGLGLRTADLDEVGDALARLARDCLVETQPIGPPWEVRRRTRGAT